MDFIFRSSMKILPMALPHHTDCPEVSRHKEVILFSPHSSSNTGLLLTLASYMRSWWLAVPHKTRFELSSTNRRELIHGLSQIPSSLGLGLRARKTLSCFSMSKSFKLFSRPPVAKKRPLLSTSNDSTWDPASTSPILPNRLDSVSAELFLFALSHSSTIPLLVQLTRGPLGFVLLTPTRLHVSLSLSLLLLAKPCVRKSILDFPVARSRTSTCPLRRPTTYELFC
mmetsp:Transcript_516/g.982  ORF Transcript_516/g.982 Transcript_516/m.982 type:complete len:226 (-) Transcript_516:421-1098(-)